MKTKKDWIKLEDFLCSQNVQIEEFLEKSVLLGNSNLYVYISKGNDEPLSLEHEYVGIEVNDFVRVDKAVIKEAVSRGHFSTKLRYSFMYKEQKLYSGKHDCKSLSQMYLKADEVEKLDLIGESSEIVYDPYKKLIAYAGEVYSLNSEKQIYAFESLYNECIVNGKKTISNQEVFSKIVQHYDEPNPNIQHVFKRSKLLNKVILTGSKKGYYRLA